MEEKMYILEWVVLGVTILGWFLTNKKQKELLERQIKADKEKSHFDVVYPLKMERIKEFLNWISMGDKMFLQCISIVTVKSVLDEKISEGKIEGLMEDKYREYIMGQEIKISENNQKFMVDYSTYRIMIGSMKEFEGEAIIDLIDEYYFPIVRYITNEDREKASYTECVEAMAKIYEIVEEVMSK